MCETSLKPIQRLYILATHVCVCVYCLCLCWAQSTNTHVSVCVYASVVLGRGLKRCLSDTDGSPLASCYIAKYISFHGWCGGNLGWETYSLEEERQGYLNICVLLHSFMQYFSPLIRTNIKRKWRTWCYTICQATLSITGKNTRKDADVTLL